MDLQNLAAPLIGVVIIFLLIKLVSLPWWLLKNSIIGAIMLYIFNFIGFFTIKITFIHCLIAGVFGIPGVIGLVAYLHFFK